MFALLKNCVTYFKTKSSLVHPPHPQSDILLDNYLEADLQRFLVPLNIIQYITFSHRYCIRDNFITSNDRYASCCSLFSSICYTVVFIVLMYYDKGLKTFISITLMLALANFISYILGFILNSIANVVQSNSYVLLVLTIRRIQKSLNVSHKQYRKFTIGNWIYVVAIYLFYILMFLFQIFTGNFVPIFLLSYLFLLLADLNMVYAIRMIQLLIYDTVLCIQELERYIEGDVEFSESTPIDSTQTDATHWDNTINAFYYIINISHVYRKLFGIWIFYNLTLIFVKSLADVQAMIAYTEFNLSLGLSILESIKYFVILMSICFGYENFIIALKNAEILFLMILSANKQGERRKVLHCLRRASGAAHAQLAAGGVVAVNAALPLLLLSVIATYTAVLLQFALS